MQDETMRLQSKLNKLEDVLEKQRWTQKEQALKFEKAIDKLERELEEERFQALYQKEQVRRYQLVLNSLAEGIYAMDSEGNVFAMNELARQQLDEDMITPILLEATGGQPVSVAIEVTSPQRFSPVDFDAPRTVSIEARPIFDEERKIVGSIAKMRILGEEDGLARD